MNNEMNAILVHGNVNKAISLIYYICLKWKLYSEHVSAFLCFFLCFTSFLSLYAKKRSILIFNTFSYHSLGVVAYIIKKGEEKGKRQKEILRGNVTWKIAFFMDFKLCVYYIWLAQLCWRKGIYVFNMLDHANFQVPLRW